MRRLKEGEWEHHYGDLSPQQIRNNGMERIGYSLGVYSEECNQVKSRFTGVVPLLQCRLDQSPLDIPRMIYEK